MSLGLRTSGRATDTALDAHHADRAAADHRARDQRHRHDQQHVGRVAVAANPLEFLNQGFKGYAAKQGQTEADAMLKDYQGRRTGMLKNLQANQMVRQYPNLGLPEQDTNPYGM